MSSLPILAGFVSTAVFVCSTFPMLRKAARTRDLTSYSLGNLALANLGNVVHSVYVFHLPPGPIWALHGFYLVSSAMMLGWYLRYAWRMGRTTHAAHRSSATSARRGPGPSLPSVENTTVPLKESS